MTIYEEAIQLINRMTLAEKVLLLEHLGNLLKQDIEQDFLMVLLYG